VKFVRRGRTSLHHMGFSLVAVLQRHIVVDEVTAAELSELGLALTIQGDTLGW
jgi:hypothetical protein